LRHSCAIVPTVRGGGEFDMNDMIAVIVFLQRNAERKYSEQMWKIYLGSTERLEQNFLTPSILFIY